MSTEVFQVRDVPAEDARIVRARAAERRVSLSQYLRDLIHEDAARPTMTEALERISRRAGVDVGSDTIRNMIAEGRR